MSILLGLLCGTVLYFLATRTEKWWARFLRNRRVNAAGAAKPTMAYFPSVAISGTLVPYFAPYIRDGLTLTVVGYDGCYFDTDPGKSVWLNTLNSWLDQNVTIEYVLLAQAPGESAIEKLQELKKAHPNRFSIYRANQSDHTDTSMAAFEREHPTFLTKREGGKVSPVAMWLENNHPPESRYAYDVTFYGEASFKEPNNTKLFEALWAKVAKLKDDPSKVIQISVLTESSKKAA